MSARIVNAGLMGIIIGLIGLVIYQGRQLREARHELSSALRVPDLPPGTNQRPVRLRLQDLPPISIRTQVRELDWSSIESDDYATYVANLRQIGCPESTIRDIILADVNELYDLKRRAFDAPPEDWEFWRHPTEATRSEEASAAGRLREAQLAGLDRERRVLVARLLGEAGAQADFEALRNRELRDRSLQFLPEAKREALAEALARWRQALEDGEIEEDESLRAERLAAAERMLNEQLSGVLSPAEREQYELRASPLAERLRDRLRGFAATREEFESMFRLERQIGEEAAASAEVTGDEAQRAESLQAASMELDQRIKETLGPERYADYQRSLDVDYQTLFSLALDHDVPASVANQVWDMRHVVEQQTDRIRENPLLTAEQKERALSAIRSETRASIVDVLGEPLLEAYQSEGGGWLLELTNPTNLGTTLPVDVEPAPDSSSGVPPQQALAEPVP